MGFKVGAVTVPTVRRFRLVRFTGDILIATFPRQLLEGKAPAEKLRTWLSPWYIGSSFKDLRATPLNPAAAGRLHAEARNNTDREFFKQTRLCPRTRVV